MLRLIGVLILLLNGVLVSQTDEKKTSDSSFDYKTARTHEIEPHRRTIPLKGVQGGFNQLHLALVVSPTGDVSNADASGDEDSMRFWPKLRDEVYGWKFIPFEKDGQA